MAKTNTIEENSNLGKMESCSIQLMLLSKDQNDVECMLDRLKELFLNGVNGWDPQPVEASSRQQLQEKEIQKRNKKQRQQ